MLYKSSNNPTIPSVQIEYDTLSERYSVIGFNNNLIIHTTSKAIAIRHKLDAIKQYDSFMRSNNSSNNL